MLRAARSLLAGLLCLPVTAAAQPADRATVIIDSVCESVDFLDSRSTDGEDVAYGETFALGANPTALQAMGRSQPRLRRAGVHASVDGRSFTFSDLCDLFVTTETDVAYRLSSANGMPVSSAPLAIQARVRGLLSRYRTLDPGATVQLGLAFLRVDAFGLDLIDGGVVSLESDGTVDATGPMAGLVGQDQSDADALRASFDHPFTVEFTTAVPGGAGEQIAIGVDFTAILDQPLGAGSAQAVEALDTLEFTLVSQDPNVVVTRVPAPRPAAAGAAALAALALLSRRRTS